MAIKLALYLSRIFLFISEAKTWLSLMVANLSGLFSPRQCWHCSNIRLN